MRKMTALSQITVTEYDDGHVETKYARLDPATRRMVYESLANYQQSVTQPYTATELHMVAAAERVARELYAQSELPW